VTIPPPPPPIPMLPAGYRLRAGRSHSTVLPDMDFETYSEAGYVWVEPSTDVRGRPKGGRWKLAATGPKSGIGVVGAAAYTEHPTFEILSLAYNLKDGSGPKLWTPDHFPPEDLYAHIRRGGLIEAFNAGFEMWVWRVMVRLYGAPPLPLRQVRCAQAKGRAWALPPALKDVGEVLQVEHGKDKDGKRLLDKFSIPRSPTKPDSRLRIRPEDDPVDGPKLYAYNLRDIVAESEVSAKVPDLSPDEQEYWFIDQAINQRGIAIDTDGLHDCIAVIEQAHSQYNAELAKLTAGSVMKASQTQRLSKWLAEQHGVQMASMDDENVQATLAGPLVPNARRALEIRSFVGSASVKKVFAIRNQLTRAGRLHDLFTFHGARTGRPTGNGPQPTNLPNSSGVYVYRCDDCSHHFSTSLTVCPWCGSAV
jgi:DNA polymerase